MVSADRVIIFPIFDECKNYTLDKYWIDCFSNFASNKFPPGMKYDSANKNIIITHKDGDEEVIAVPDDPPEAFTLLIKIMKQKLGMRSTRDIKIKQDVKKPDSKCEFKTIRLKHVRDQLIMDYIGSLREKYNLTTSEYNIAVSSINLGFQFKSITPDNVVYEDGQITHIKGLTFDTSKRRFILPSYAKVQKSEKPASIDTFVTGMKKYIRENNIRAQKYVL